MQNNMQNNINPVRSFNVNIFLGKLLKKFNFCTKELKATGTSNGMKKKVLVFASGSKGGGGSGFANLVKKSKENDLPFEVVAVVSNHSEGGVKKRADELSVPFFHFEKPFTAERYHEIVAKHSPDVIALSGWLKLVTGLPADKTINIHPGPLPRFGGAGMYGHFVHEAVIEAFKKGEVTHSAVTMHFVTENYDEGPVFFTCAVPIFEGDTAVDLATRALEAEHKWQPIITAKVAVGEISWDGKDSATLKGRIDL